MENKVTVGALIKRRRVQLFMSRVALGELVGVGECMISYVETGKRRLSLHTLQSVIKALHFGKRDIKLLIKCYRREYLTDLDQRIAEFDIFKDCVLYV